MSVLIVLRMITFNWSNYRRKEDAAEVPGHLLLMQGLRQELSQTKNYMHILSCYNWMAFVLLVYNHVHRILLVLHTTTLWYRFLRRKTDNGHNDPTDLTRGRRIQAPEEITIPNSLNSLPTQQSTFNISCKYGELLLYIMLIMWGSKEGRQSIFPSLSWSREVLHPAGPAMETKDSDTLVLNTTAYQRFQCVDI